MDKSQEDKEKVQSEKPKGLSSNFGIEISFIANLKRHTKSVNILRWNNDGKILASAGDEAVIFLWNENDIKNQKTLDNDEYENKENWYSFKTFRYENFKENFLIEFKIRNIILYSEVTWKIYWIYHGLEIVKL